MSELSDETSELKRRYAGRLVGYTRGVFDVLGVTLSVRLLISPEQAVDELFANVGQEPLTVETELGKLWVLEHRLLQLVMSGRIAIVPMGPLRRTLEQLELSPNTRSQLRIAGDARDMVWVWQVCGLSYRELVAYMTPDAARELTLALQKLGLNTGMQFPLLMRVGLSNDCASFMQLLNRS